MSQLALKKETLDIFDDWSIKQFSFPERKLRLGTVFSGIGAIEHALKRLGLNHEIVFAGDIDDKVKESYFANCKISENQWHNDISSLEPNNLLPKILLQNSKRDTISSNFLTKDKITVIYFWSQTQMNQYRNSIERVNRFKKKYPKIRFVGICIQPFNTMVDEIQKIMEVDKKNQFALIDFETASKAWVLTLLNKAMIIDPQGRVVEGFGNFSDTNFEILLKKID